MNEKIGEQLSALIDNELESEQEELLVRRVLGDAELQSRWERYQLIRDVLHNNLPDRLNQDFLRQVQARIAVESADTTASAPSVVAAAGGGRAVAVMARPIAGLAVAASVALMAVVGMQNLRQEVGPVPAAGFVAQADPRQANDSGMRWNLHRPEAENRLNTYLVNHNEYTSSTSLQGMLNYSRIAGYDTQR